MVRIGGRLKAAGAVALALSCLSSPLLAQTANDWRLPGATVRPAPPGSQGPVDRDNPVVTTTAPRVVPTEAPAPSPSQAAPQPSTAATSAPAATRTPAARPAATAQRTAQPAPSPTTTVTAPTASPTTELPSAVPTFAPVTTPSAAPTVPDAAPASAADDSGWYWKWVAGLAALVALVFAGLWLRRSRQPEVLQIAFERPIVPAAQPQVPADPTPQPVAAAPIAPPQMPQSALAAATMGPLGVSLVARRMSASLMATTLSYAVTLTNTGSEPLTMVAVEGDMISAHASLPPEAQIASDNQVLEPKHNMVSLAPGESAEFTGDFRLPLTAVTPIRAGEAAYFVPLARLRIKASKASGESLVQVQTYVVGELPDDPAAALKPFRLDLGPRTYSRVGQRAVG